MRGRSTPPPPPPAPAAPEPETLPPPPPVVEPEPAPAPAPAPAAAPAAENVEAPSQAPPPHIWQRPIIQYIEEPSLSALKVNINSKPFQEFILFIIPPFGEEGVGEYFLKNNIYFVFLLS